MLPESGRTMATIWFLLLYVAASWCSGEHVRDLEISEGAAVGTRIGFIGDGAQPDSGPPYLIVPVGSSVDSDLSIDQNTGEVRTKVAMDREVRASYSFVAIPISGDNVKVFVKVLDENDNAPTFSTSLMSIEFPENTPRDVKRTLLPAKDLDLDIYNTQKYNIVSGNVNNAFRLSSHRERDGVLYLDMQINGFLDRETTSSYSLVIEALDGGTPPLRGEMIVNITIQDVNDNQPIFNQSRYFAAVPENATIGTTVLQVFATDSDAGENGLIEYFINRRQSDKDAMFKIEPNTGVISVNKPLDFETKELHELVIVAKDRGLQPLETTAFVSIKVTDVNDNQPTINVIFLSDDATPKISESAQAGDFVARISVNDPDSKTDYSNINVTLSGGEGHFGLTTQDNIIYLVIVSLPLDREIQPNYTLNVEATDTGTPPLHATRTINLKVTDINDNAPEFEKDVYHANVMEVSDPGSSVIQVIAHDKDEGNNSVITYTLVDTPDTHSSWFRIDTRSGLVTTKAHVDCETNPVPQLTIIATDSGFPPLSSTAKVFVTIHDVNDNEPIFDQSFYNVSVIENEPIGRCILKVSATDPDCGVNAMVNYTLDHSFGNMKEFEVRSGTGEVCILSGLDYESRNVYEFPVIATDRGGLSTTAMIKIQVTDANDNRPVFYPREYNVSLREGGLSTSTTMSTPVVIVAATDPDSGKFGTLTYRITSGNDAGLFRIDRNTGEILVTRPNMLSSRTKRYHRLNISASDGGGLKSEADAEVFISIIDSAQKPPIFEYPRYTFSVKEDVRRNTVIGSVKATIGGDSASTPHAIRYSIYSGDPDGFFSIDPVTGSIRTSSSLDHEVKTSVLLNIQATSGEPPSYGHTQVNIEIEDVNDNAPEFESNTVKISIPENVDVGTPLYAAHARDKDSGLNGVVRYKLVNKGAIGGLFDVDAKLGHVTLTRYLDYETAERHSLVITASDMGTPTLSANLTVLVDVQDVNDNPPVFERAEYEVKILETLPINSQIIQVTAIDLDTGNNARLTYRLLMNNSTLSDSFGTFGVFPNSGWIYLKQNLDREVRDRYDLSVVATDNGTPTESATTRVIVNILDANDNDPVFDKEIYEFNVEENQIRGSYVGSVKAVDKDVGLNAAVRYFLIPSNSSFQINPISGIITTKDTLDREHKEQYDLVVEARDQGTPARNSRQHLRVFVLDVNDNAPEIVDPQEDVISVREEQPSGTEVVRVRAIDVDKGNNASITYAILKNRDSDGQNVFSIDPSTGIIRTKVVLAHEEKTIYRLAVAATDKGTPPKQTLRTLRVEVLDLNDNRPTFTSSSLVFRVREDVKVGFVVGSIAPTYSAEDSNLILAAFGQITYALNSLGRDALPDAFDIDRSTGSLVVARRLDREKQSEYRLEVRALDTSATNNPQSSAVTVRVDIADANDNAPHWNEDPISIYIGEDALVGSAVYNFSASDLDSGTNGDLKYKLIKQHPDVGGFTIDPLTGTLLVTHALDYERIKEYVLIVRATDQSLNVSERLSTTVTTRITLTDVNDNAPKFVLPATSSMYFARATSVGMPVGYIMATDEDSGENARVTYVISSGNDNGYFSLGYDSGILTLAKTIADPNQMHHINITASDHGNPARHTQKSLKLSLQDFIESPPRFAHSAHHFEIAEDATPGAFVTKLITKTSSDRDANLTFFIPNGVADDTFAVDAHTGIVSTAKGLDRENVTEYLLPVYVTDSNRKDHFDVTKLKISVLDVNDHAPEFKTGACYPLSIPENSDTNVIHMAVAIDLDTGNNGLLSYSIVSGNNGNKFSINASSGEITAKSLDRESQSRYHLTIVAHDKGSPSLQGSCNITIFVEDVNDNDPKFDSNMYATRINEDVPIDTSVLLVKAVDGDVGINAKIIYSIANESQWLFRIDNKTGVISTAGLFDRERQAEYNFQVVATDNGKSNARSQRVPVKVIIGDVNDNKPRFAKYPYKEKVTAYVQPGQALVRVTATDDDEGTNAEVVYSLTSKDDNGKFNINPNTGVISATQSLASEIGKIIHLNILATDKGNPPQYAHGLVEIVVGELVENMPKLTFQNYNYRVIVPENTEEFKQILQVSAVRSDGRRQRIFYSFGSGNEANAFLIDSETGVIQVRNSKYLDYELYKEIHLVVAARSEGIPSLYGYCDVVIQLTDQNDNAPKFTQQQYTASVFEGNAKGTFVLQTVAFDVDEGKNAMIRYHIVDGNHDNAFKIEPAFSGILKTSIVLDREIRDTYRLTVIAIDEGVPQMTGTARIRINIVDVNDNQPTFPPHSIITVPEDTPVGTVLTTVTANDVDTNPVLVYSFAPDMDKNILRNFSIDRFSGKVILKHPLDYELRQEYKLKIIASDEAHIANTMLVVRVTDVNDNTPRFSQLSYQAVIPIDNSKLMTQTMLSVNASDADSGENGRIKYSLAFPVQGFSVGTIDGVLKVNTSNFSTSSSRYVTIKAEDSGSPTHSATTVARVTLQGSDDTLNHIASNSKELRVHVLENVTLGTSILTLQESENYYYIVDGNDEDNFEIVNRVLVVMKRLDRETKDIFKLRIASGSIHIEVQISVDDVNDNSPRFNEESYQVTISEGTPIGASLIKVTAHDDDLSNTFNSQVVYEITSGNDESLFAIANNDGVIKVAKTLDYDTGNVAYKLVVRACDSAELPQCSLALVYISLEDINDNEPNFPVSEYLEFVAENESVGTSVFIARATDMDGGKYGKINYTIVSASANNYPIDDAWKLFNIDSESGLVTTNVVFDYEVRNRYIFLIRASDIGEKIAEVKVRLEIESRDEFYPHFTERTYKFILPVPSSGALPSGLIVGQVTATDRDKGPDGRVVYQLTTQNPHFKINRTTGAVVVKKKMDLANLGREISLVVTASSGKQNSLTNMTVVEITLDESGDMGLNLAINNQTVAASNGGIADWALGLLIALLLLLLTFGALFVFLHMKNKRNKKVNKPNLGGQEPVTTNNYVDPSAFDTIPIRGTSANVQFAPPKYDEIPPYGAAASSNSGAATTSELSGSEQSGSSGRGSAEDGDDNDDEEIRMINEGPLQRDSGIHRQNDDEDNLSDVSVRNTQEYLARLGIVNSNTAVPQTSRINQVPLDSLIFDEEANADNDIANFYAKLNDVANSDRASSTDDAVGVTMEHMMNLSGYGQVPTHQPSMNGSLSSIVHSEEELAGSYNWDYLLDWGPQYQPLAHVFSEIARLKDDTVSVQSGASGSSAKSKNSQAKTVPPPLITGVAPRAIPVLNSRGGSNHHLNQINSVLPRSPISHDLSSQYNGSAAMSPSFSPSLSPLATKSPSISPLVTPGLTTAHHVRQAPARTKTTIDGEMRI